MPKSNEYDKLIKYLENCERENREFEDIKFAKLFSPSFGNWFLTRKLDIVKLFQIYGLPTLTYETNYWVFIAKDEMNFSKQEILFTALTNCEVHNDGINLLKQIENYLAKPIGSEKILKASQKLKNDEAKEYREIVDEELTKNSVKRFVDNATDISDRKENIANSTFNNSEWEREWKTLNDNED